MFCPHYLEFWIEIRWQTYIHLSHFQIEGFLQRTMNNLTISNDKESNLEHKKGYILFFLWKYLCFGKDFTTIFNTDSPLPKSEWFTHAELVSKPRSLSDLEDFLFDISFVFVVLFSFYIILTYVLIFSRILLWLHIVILVWSWNLLVFNWFLKNEKKRKRMTKKSKLYLYFKISAVSGILCSGIACIFWKPSRGKGLTHDLRQLLIFQVVCEWCTCSLLGIL